MQKLSWTPTGFFAMAGEGQKSSCKLTFNHLRIFSTDCPRVQGPGIETDAAISFVQNSLALIQYLVQLLLSFIFCVCSKYMCEKVW
jgi:hypothetical protein